MNGSGVTAQTMSSTSADSVRQVSTAAMGTAATSRPGPSWRRPATAARMVDPVARPSSTRITVRPVTSSGGRVPR
jgi:hypothetical protein